MPMGTNRLSGPVFELFDIGTQVLKILLNFDNFLLNFDNRKKL